MQSVDLGPVFVPGRIFRDGLGEGRVFGLAGKELEEEHGADKAADSQNGAGLCLC